MRSARLREPGDDALGVLQLDILVAEVLAGDPQSGAAQSARSRKGGDVAHVVADHDRPPADEFG